jgi:26 proteasome complex subunit DSS1
MSASTQNTAATSKTVVDDKTKNGETDKDKKPVAQLEEDDEFEDFPIEGGSRLRSNLLGQTI